MNQETFFTIILTAIERDRTRYGNVRRRIDQMEWNVHDVCSNIRGVLLTELFTRHREFADDVRKRIIAQVTEGQERFTLHGNGSMRGGDE